MSNHTPGPWVTRSKTLHHTVYPESRDGIICSIDRCEKTKAEDIANAQLIAAAPELLEACRRVLASGLPELRIISGENMQCLLITEKVVRIVRDAINVATVCD